MREKKQRKMQPLREIIGKTKEFILKSEWDKKKTFSHQPMIVLLYKETFLNTNELDHTLPSSITSLLQAYENVFPRGNTTWFTSDLRV